MNNENVIPWYEGLPDSARGIVENNNSPLKILAGPGTGKTFILMRRVARLLQKSEVDASKIFVSTFTRTAANDIRKELTRLGIDTVENVRSETLHAFCFSLLSKESVFKITNRNPRLLLDFEKRFLLQDLEGANFGSFDDKQDRLKAFSAAWARLQTEEPGWASDPVDQAFQRRLLDWTNFHRAMLIEEIVPETLRYLRDNPLSEYRNAFDHILVDEFQDLNRAEQELIYLLSNSGTLTIAGDPNQSIYSFKYVHPEGITDINIHSETLMECKRCPKSIVQMANTLISNNEHRINNSISSCSDNESGEIKIIQWPSMEDEAQGIAQFIAKRIDADEVKAGNVLVLAPRRKFGYAIRDALINLNKPAHSFFHEEALDGNPKYLDKCMAQQSFTLLTLLANPDDRVALRCWCGFGSTSLLSRAWLRLRTYCENNGDSPMVALEKLTSNSIKLPYTSELKQRYQKLQNRLQTLYNLRGQALIDTLFPQNMDWALPFRSLVSEEDNIDAIKMRETLRIGITQPELPTDVDYVRIMSLHKSKGLTADLVIVVGCVEGLVPSVKDNVPIIEQKRLLEEQRRLFYVAITRAKKTLVLSSITRIPRKLAHNMGIVVRGGNENYGDTITSKFVNELGPTRPFAVPGQSILKG